MSDQDERSEWYTLDKLSLDELVYNAAVALEQDNPVDAELILRHAEERCPDDGNVQLGLGDVLLTSKSPESQAQVRRAAALAADDPVRLTRAANQMLCIGDLVAARDLVIAAVKVLPEEFEYAAALSYVIGRLAEAGDNDEVAEEMFENAYETEPDNEDYGYSWARFLAQRGENDRARDVVEQSLMHNPDDEWLLGLRAELTEATAPEA